jgi:eukaryotic-like serine/threonine-protein kinase
MPDERRIRQLVENLLVSQRTPEEVCANDPELLSEVRRRLEQVRGVERAFDQLLPLATPTQVGPADLVTPAGQPLPALEGHDVEGVLGRGGMGVVYRARHRALNRPVAVKMLLAGACAGPQELARFRLEAEAVAGLRHPNIVQVHDAGEVEGRPFFTMELVEGGSLAQQLGGTPLPVRQAAELVAVLAGAVQFAHRSGIVHRDLKPANILLTADGTPKITDFGLARRLQGGAGLTQSGAQMGTPCYMAPEQARGQTRAIGPAVDVHALGAILYELLTGRPPFRAETAAATVLQVISQEPVPPARLNARVPRDLGTICLKCLEKDPGKRYATAGELAADLERFLKYEPILARPTGRVEQCLRWVRRRPAVAVLLSAVVLFVLAGGVGAWQFYQQRAAAQARQAQTDGQVRGILERARGLLEDGWRAHDLAKLTESRAEGNRAADIAHSGEASAAVQREAERFRADAVARLERAQKNRALLEALLDVSALQETPRYARGEAGRMVVLAQPSVDRQYAAAFRRWGLDMDGTSEAEVAQRLSREPDVVVQEVIAGLDAWMLERRSRRRPEAEWRRLFRVAEHLDRSAQHRRLRAWLIGGSPLQAETAAGLVGAASPWSAVWGLTRGNAWRHLLKVRKGIDPSKEPVLTVMLLARAFTATGDSAGAEEVLRQAATTRPDQVVLLTALGKLLEQQPHSRLDEAIGYYRAARALRRSLGIALGEALERAGRARQGEEVLRELALRQPDNPAVYLCLGINLSVQGKHVQAEAAYRKAIALQPDYANAHYNCGAALNRQGRHVEAEAALRKAIALQPGDAEAHSNLGYSLLKQGKHVKAEAAFRKAIALKPGYVEARYNLGLVLSLQGKRGEAEAAYHKAIALKPDLAEGHHDLGNVLSAQGKHAAAEAAYHKAIALKPGYVEACYHLGMVLSAQRKHAAAEAAYHKAIALKPDLAEAHHNLGIVLSAQRKHAAAEAAFRKAIALKPGHVEARYNLGIVLTLQGKHGEAEAAYHKAIALKPDFPEAHHHLGIALMQQARFHEAAASLKTAIDLRPAADPRRGQARQLQQLCQRCVLLDARLPSILRGTEKPANAAEQIEFAQVCVLKKLYAAAARLCTDAFAMKPQLAESPGPGHRYAAARSAALAGCGQGEDGAKLDDTARARWRAQARRWLRADLDALARKLESGLAADRAEVQKTLARWRQDPPLAGLRDPDALEKLPPAERQECRTLWGDLDALLRRARLSK